MRNLLSDHPSEEVRAAAVRLLDALCQWERATSRHNIVIIKDSIGVGYRSLDGVPIPDYMTDSCALESFDILAAPEAQ